MRRLGNLRYHGPASFLRDDAMKPLLPLLAACLGLFSATLQADEEKVLHVYNWSDYIAEDTLENFQKETGIKVVYDVFSDNAVVEAKLLAGNTGYDVVVPSLHFLARQIQAGVFQPLDKQKLTHLNNLDAQLLKQIDTLDPGNQYGVPYLWGTTALGYNVKKVKEVLGEQAPLNSWALLFDPANAAKLAQCGIALLDAPEEIYSAAINYTGGDPNDTSPAVLREKAQPLLMQLRPHIRYIHGSQYINDLANGDICLVLGYSGDILQARDRAEEANNGVEVAYVIPQEGASLWFDMLVIPKDAPHPGNAHLFINYLLRPEVIASITNAVNYANPNPASRGKVDPTVLEDPGVYPDTDTSAKLFMLQPTPLATERVRTRLWSEFQAGK